MSGSTIMEIVTAKRDMDLSCHSMVARNQPLTNFLKSFWDPVCIQTGRPGKSREIVQQDGRQRWCSCAARMEKGPRPLYLAHTLPSI